MKIMISGSSGLIGSALKESLEADGHSVEPLPRTYEEPIDFAGTNAVVHLAGENIAGGRWNAAKKCRIRESRINGTQQLAGQLAASADRPIAFICASAIGFYGNRGNETHDESSPAGEGFLPDVCKEWEAAARPAAEAGIRTVHLRTGIVLRAEGGALKKMLTPFKMGAGGRLGHGMQYMSWISLADQVHAIRFLIDSGSISGPVNLVAPNPVTNREFTRTLGRVLRRPAVVPMPAFAVKGLFGEMGVELLLGSTRVVPKKLVDAGYTFCHDNLQSALEEIL